MNRKSKKNSALISGVLLLCLVFIMAAMPVLADEYDGEIAKGISTPANLQTADEHSDVLAKGVSDPANPQSKEETLSVYTVHVDKGYLALRNACAFKSSNEIGKLDNGDTVIRCPISSEKNGYWYVYSPKLKKLGYVNSDYLKYKKAYTNNYKVKVKTGYLALRSKKAFDSSNEKGEMYTGDTVIALNTSDKTYWTVYSPLLEKTGYTNMHYLTKATGTKDDSGTDTPAAEKTEPENPVVEEPISPPDPSGGSKEKNVPMIIPTDALADWLPGTGHYLQFCCQVKNTSKDKTITSFDVYVFAEDKLGQRISDGVLIYNVTTKETVEPGETTYTNYVSLPYRNDICKIYTAVRRCTFSDGTYKVNNTLDKSDYTIWTIQ